MGPSVEAPIGRRPLRNGLRNSGSIAVNWLYVRDKSPKVPKLNLKDPRLNVVILLAGKATGLPVKSSRLKIL